MKNYTVLIHQIACQGIMKYCLRDLLGCEQRETLFSLLDALTSLLAETHKRDEVGGLQKQLNMALAMLERDFPISVQVCV